jgi:hypothetical protein
VVVLSLAGGRKGCKEKQLRCADSDEPSVIKRIYIPEEIILLLSDNPESASVLAPTTYLDELIIGRVIRSWQAPSK